MRSTGFYERRIESTDTGGPDNFLVVWAAQPQEDCQIAQLVGKAGGEESTSYLIVDGWPC